MLASRASPKTAHKPRPATAPAKTSPRVDKDVIAVISRDNIRTLKAHTGAAGKASLNGAVVLNPKDFQRIRSEAKVLSPDDIQQQAVQLAREHARASEESRSRKLRMAELELERTANAKLSEAEAAAKKQNNYLLAKAMMQLEEEEDEIKHMNEMMLYAKCVAIRDIQMGEKAIIKKAVKEVDAHLDAMMEADRTRDLQRMEEAREARVAELRRGAAVIRKQIEGNREAALLEQEKKDQETKHILKQIRDMQDQEAAEKQAKVRAQRKLMEEVVKANSESTKRKKQQKLLDMEEDKKVLQYILDKEKKDAEADAAAKLRNAERDKEATRLRAAQQKMTDKQSQQDALRAKRAQEAYEREWRRKEKELAEKTIAQEVALREERARQQLDRERAVEEEARQIKAEFYENIARRKIEEDKLAIEENKRLERSKAYSLELQAQIAEREEQRRKERTEFFMEGVKLSAERAQQKKRLEGVKDRKLAELRQLGVPEKYCAGIARKMACEKQIFSKMAIK